MYSISADFWGHPAIGAPVSGFPSPMAWTTLLRS